MKFSYLILLSVIMIIFLLSCSSEDDVELPEEYVGLENVTIYEPEIEPASEILLEPDAYYGDTDDVIIGSLGTCIVDETGRVFIPDWSENIIHVYQPDGTWIRSIGRDGEGPGEFRNVGVLRTDDQNLHVFDRTQRRISIFDLETLEFVTAFNLAVETNNGQNEPGQYPSDFFVRPDGNYLIVFQGSPFAGEDQTKSVSLYDRMEERYVDHSLQTFRLDEMLLSSSSDMRIGVAVPYMGRSVIEYYNGGLVHGWSKNLLLSFFDDAGTYQHARYYPFGHAELDRNDVLEYYSESSEMVKQLVRSDNMPDVWPAFNHIIPDDDGRLWISTIVEDQEVYDWWVLDESGELLATFIWPRDRTIHEVKNGYLYSRETDEMGLPGVIRYGIRFSER